MDFELGHVVKIKASGEIGEVIGRAEYVHCEPSYFIRYKSADGRAVEIWWTQTALELC